MKMNMKIQKRNILSLAVFLVSFECLQLVISRSYNNGLIFYDLQTFQPFLPPTVSVSRGRGLASVKYSSKGSIWSTFGKPCECHQKVCGCCAGIRVKQYNFNQKMCANVTFVPPKEEALLEVYLNGKPSSKYGISVRNPSPFCIPVMMGIPMAMCVQMSDIAIKGNNLNMCMDFIVRLATTDLFEMHFQCMQMGLDGFQYIDKDGNPVIPPSNTKNSEIDGDDDDYYDYDEADENEENEIAYAANGQNDQKYIEQPHHTIANTIDGSYIIGLQQQMLQLQMQKAQQHQQQQQFKIEKNDLVTQINDDDATLPPIVGEAQTEIIAAITAAYGTAAVETEPATEAAVTPVQAEAVEATESETETESEVDADAKPELEAEVDTEIAPLAAATINPANNELSHDAHDNNYVETTTETTATTTTAAANVSTAAAVINESIKAHTTADASVSNNNKNNASDAFNATDSTIDIATTTTTTTTERENDTATTAFLSAPIAPTAVGAIEAATSNSVVNLTAPTVVHKIHETQEAAAVAPSYRRQLHIWSRRRILAF